MFSFLLPIFKVLRSPWVALGMLAIVLLSFAFNQGAKRAQTACDMKSLKSLQVAQTLATIETARREQVAADYASQVARTQVVFQTIDREVFKNVYQNSAVYVVCSLDDDGLRLWNAANEGSAETVRSGSDDAVPIAAASGIGAVDRLTTQPHVDHAVVSGVSGQASGVGGV